MSVAKEKRKSQFSWEAIAKRGAHGKKKRSSNVALCNVNHRIAENFCFFFNLSKGPDYNGQSEARLTV